MVELMARYSKLADQVSRTSRLVEQTQQTWPVRTDDCAKPPRRIELRLTDAQLDELVAGYRAGATGRELAAEFGIARSSVMGVLRERGVRVRRPRLTQEECEVVARLYRDGMQQIDIAQQLGREKATIWHVLRRMGLR